MSYEHWTDEENDLIVADYFAMLAADIVGRPYSKAEHRRKLQPLLRNRSEGSIEYKHQNISAVLMGLGQRWILGYKPSSNYQLSLVNAIDRWSRRNEIIPIHESSDVAAPWMNERASGIAEPPVLEIAPPPDLRQPLRAVETQMLHMARRLDLAGRDQRNRNLGKAGEEYVFEHERASLATVGRSDLAKKVRWVSRDEGDGAGYDIKSFTMEGQPKLIEVKTTNGWERTPFYITRNELAVADERRADWRLLRLWNFAQEPKAFQLSPPLNRHVSLTATTFQADFECDR